MSKIRVGILSAASSFVAGFDAAAYVAGAIVDQSWAGLITTPGDWEVLGGVEDYSGDNLTQATSDALSMRLDISSSATNDVPGWLLVLFEYPDVANVHITADTINLAGTRTQAVGFIGTGGLDFTTSIQRIESDNAVDCSTSSNSGLQIINPSDNSVWLGAHTFLSTPPIDQYEEGTLYLVTDPDGVSLGSFSGDPCGEFHPDTIKYLRFVLESDNAGDVSINRILLFNTYPPDPAAVSAVFAELGFTTP